MNKGFQRWYFVAFGVGMAIFFWLLETVMHVFVFRLGSFSSQFLPLDDTNEMWMRSLICLLFIGFGAHIQSLTNRRLLLEEQREALIKDLERSLEEIKALRGIFPICAHCKKIRNDKGYWEAVETYFHKHQQFEFTHSICPDCIRDHYPDFARKPPPKAAPHRTAD